MIILNYSHPLNSNQIAQLEALTGRPVERCLDLPVQFDPDQPFEPQLRQLQGQLSLESSRLETGEFMIIPPALNFIAALVLADLHGRMGYFPPVVRLRPVEGAVPPRFEIAEILSLQTVREAARKERR